jgi:hypothetical protein
MLFILSQVLGVVALVTAIISVQLKEKTKLLLLQIIENSAKILALGFVGGMSGAYSETVGLLRKVWFFHTSKHHKRNRTISLVVFCSLAILVSILTWEGVITLLPMLAVILGTIGLWQENMFVLRYLAIVASILYATYALFVGAYTNAVSETFMIGSIIISLIRFSRLPKEKTELEKIKLH